MGLSHQDLPFSMMQMTEPHMGHQGGWGPSGKGPLLAPHDLGNQLTPLVSTSSSVRWVAETVGTVSGEQESAGFSIFRMS